MRQDKQEAISFRKQGRSYNWIHREIGIPKSTRITGPLAPGATVNLTITLRLQPCASTNAWLNYAEVSYMENTSGANVSMADIDSDADNTNGNDAGGQAESPADDYINGYGTGTPGRGVAATDLKTTMTQSWFRYLTWL